MKKVLFKIGISLLIVINIYVAFMFYTLAIPIRLNNMEDLVIHRIASVFNVPDNVARIYFYHGKLKNIEPVMVAVIATVESQHNPKAVSKKGYKGTMQSSKTWFAYNSVEIMNGVEEYNEWLVRNKGNIRVALAKYNGGNNPPGESYKYADYIIKTTEKIKKQVYI